MKMGKIEWGFAGLLFAGSMIFFSTFGAQADGGTVQSGYTTNSTASVHAGPYHWGGRTFNDKADLAIYFLQRLAREGITGLPSRDDDENDDNNNGSDDLTVRTEAATSIDEDGARMEGEVDNDGSDRIRVWFEYGEERNDLDEETPKRSINTSADRITFQATVNGLDEDTTYYYRAVVEDEDGDVERGSIRSFTTDDDNGSSNNGDDEPEADTGGVDDVEDSSAQLEGHVDMNDFEDGIVFFVYGTDENMIEDVDSDFDTYSEIDEDGDKLQKEQVATNLDDSASYDLDIDGLDDDTEYFYAIGVEYEDENGNDTLLLGNVESFTTDNN